MGQISHPLLFSRIQELDLSTEAFSTLNHNERTKEFGHMSREVCIPKPSIRK